MFSNGFLFFFFHNLIFGQAVKRNVLMLKGSMLAMYTISAKEQKWKTKTKRNLPLLTSSKGVLLAPLHWYLYPFPFFFIDEKKSTLRKRH